MLFICKNIRLVVQKAKSNCSVTEQKATGTKIIQENTFMHKKPTFLLLFELLGWMDSSEILWNHLSWRLPRAVHDPEQMAVGGLA